jgi:hypothetical protein
MRGSLAGSAHFIGNAQARDDALKGARGAEQGEFGPVISLCAAMKVTTNITGVFSLTD